MRIVRVLAVVGMFLFVAFVLPTDYALFFVIGCAGAIVLLSILHLVRKT